MKFNPYLKGRRFEYRVQKFLKGQGWFVVRQPRSAFPDLIALKRDAVILIECRMQGGISTKERRNLTRLACKELGGRAVVALRNGVSIDFREYKPHSRKPKQMRAL